jgi:hypothetical protein
VAAQAGAATPWAAHNFPFRISLADTPMTNIEAAELIETMIASIKTNPAQFNISVSVIGQSVVSHGGIGMKVTAVGGGPGSTTIGNQVSMGGAGANRTGAGGGGDESAIRSPARNASKHCNYASDARA